MTRANKPSTEMTIREAFAMAAMQGLATIEHEDLTCLVKHAVKYADALLAELAKTAPVDTAPAADEWIPWGGGECPVGYDVTARVKLRNGMEQQRNAGTFRWFHISTSSGDDIVGYRSVKGGEA